MIKEGGTKLRVPRESLNTANPPTAPVFFNPAAELNRDISVAVTEATGGITFCDALSGIGSRGVRIAKEVSRPTKVTFVDFNEDSLSLARKNASHNGVIGKSTFVHEDTNRFLFSRFRRNQKFDYVDIDPFGTPAPFLQAACAAASDGAILSVTATDTAVLCGVYPEVARRRYSAVPLKSEFKHETGLRILVNACRRAAALGDLGIEPVLAHSTLHYFRAFMRVVLGARAADRTMEGEGYLILCRKCKHAVSSPKSRGDCPRCGSLVVPGGPLWVGPLVDEAILKRAIEVSRERGFDDAERVLRSLIGVNDFPPVSYSLDRIAAELRIPGISDSLVSQELARRGLRSMRQPFEKRGLKTDADYSELVSAVRAVSGLSPEVSLHPMQK